MSSPVGVPQNGWELRKMDGSTKKGANKAAKQRNPNDRSVNWRHAPGYWLTSSRELLVPIDCQPGFLREPFLIQRTELLLPTT